jgi:DNA-binding response OmpR family regulator
VLDGVPLSKLQAKIVLIVSRHSPTGISQSDLADSVYADRIDGGPENALVTLRTSIHQLNKKLRAYHSSIRIIGRGGYGYRLVQDDW